uniref:Death domain-containing protein n=1 Tax=Amphimedon queenslandica TaxID=400682 RepID=A0A1X7TUD3_AMPQE
MIFIYSLEGRGRQLYDAAMNRNIEGMRTALSNGADINWHHPGLLNYTPLHVAAECNRSDAVQWLLSKGATVDSRDKLGQTPLMYAARNGHTQVVTMLLEKGADVTASDIVGWTALDHAEQYRRSDIATLLRVHSDLLSLLKHLLLVSPIVSSTGPTRYFLPIVLSPEKITKEQKETFTETCDPLVISFNSKLVLQGLFPTLIVSLLSRKESPHFFIDSKSPFFPKQLRHAVKLYSEDLFGSVIFVDEHKFIEVYFTGNPKDCSVLRPVILEGLSASAAALAYNEETLGISAVTYCPQKHRSRETERNPHPIEISYKRDPPEIRCSIETDLPPIALTDERQSCWLLDPVPPSVVPIETFLPEGSVLNEFHAPVILKAVKKIVNEWDTLGLYLGVQNEDLLSIDFNSLHQINVCRKNMIVHWLKTGTATREKLIKALEDLERNDVAAEVKRLPYQ